MAKLVEQTIPSLFGGVSKQPDAVRRLEQVESADNALLSVVTGGFEKRPPTQFLKKCTYLSTTADYAFHPIDRSTTEQYIVLVDGTAPNIVVVDAISGDQETVTVNDTVRYFMIETSNLDGTGVVQVNGANMSEKLAPESTETTFDWSWKLTDGTTGRFKVEGSADGSVWNDIATGKGGATSGTFSTTIGAVATGDHNYIRINITTGMATAGDTMTIKATFKDLTYILDAGSEDLRMATVADTTFIANRNVLTRMAEADSGSIAGTVQTFSDLPAATGSGNVQHVIGNAADGFGSYYVEDATGSVWQEHYDVTAHNEFDKSSMPHLLQRTSTGVFTYGPADWEPRRAGDEEIVEQPGFIGLPIQEVTFYRNRTTLIADEKAFCGQVGAPFNLWPEKAIEVLDSDPVERGATENDIHILKTAAVFRKILFVTSVRGQFELTSSGSFTPASATFDLATAYPASDIARPTVVGDVLYFPGVGADHATIYEYFFDEASLSNTASDTTKHVPDYIKNDVLRLQGDATSQTTFILTTNDQNRLYVYRTFFDGTEKLQSAWSRYEFGATEAAAFIIGFAVMSGFVVMLIQREDGAIYLEQMPIEREDQDATMGYTPFLDQREIVTGTHDTTYNVTHWDLSYEHNDDVKVVLGPNFTDAGAQPTPFFPSRYTLTLATVLAGETIVLNGNTYTAHATTTTTANKEFSISGNDIADAGELTTCINDATDGVTGVTATDNGDGTITLNMDDKGQDDGITAPTGTAITNATITAVELNDLVAAAGDHDTNQAYVGRNYTMSVQLSKIFVRDGTPAVANITGRLQLKDITFRLVDTGYLLATVAPQSRTSYTYSFEGRTLGDNAVIGPPTMGDEFFRVPIWANNRTVDITLSNDQPMPCVVASAAWRGMFNEITRQD